MHSGVQLLVSPTKSNRSFDVLAVVIRRNFSSPVMQTTSSAEAMPSPAYLLPFAWLDVNSGRQLCKLKHRAAQIKTKIASAPGIEGWETRSSRGERRITEGGGRESSPWQRPKAPRCVDNDDLRSGGWHWQPSYFLCGLRRRLFLPRCVG